VEREKNKFQQFMQPFERFKKLNTEGNLWIYILLLGKEEEICNKDIRRLIFEKFCFLPNILLLKRVLYCLKRDEYIKIEKFKGERAYKTTEKGIKELEEIKKFYHKLLQRV